MCQNHYQKEWRKRDPEKARQRNRRSYLRHRDKILSHHKERRKKHPYQNKDVLTAATKRYMQTERGRAIMYALKANRRARKKNAKGRATVTQIQARWDYYGRLCYLCMKTAVASDHVIPLSRGGSNWPSNLRPICKSCNSRKNNRTLREYLLCA
jgi:5-methylcytosine-specific restriction endonuclease McrA